MNAQVVDAPPKGNAHFDRLADGRERYKSSIVNVTCIHNRSGFTRSAAYAATEGALIALTSELAEEFRGKGIRINAVGPGLVEVPRYFGIPGYTVEFGSTPMLAGRLERPRYVAHAVAFLAAADVGFTGQVL